MVRSSVLPRALQELPRRLALFWRLPGSDRVLFLQVFGLLGLARLAILVVPFPTLATHFGQRMAESPDEAPPEHLRIAYKISKIIRMASPYTPWTSNCFPQALAAKYLLNRRGIASTLYLGANFKAEGQMAAHAWLRCGPLFVTGGVGHRSYGTVAYFS